MTRIQPATGGETNRDCSWSPDKPSAHEHGLGLCKESVDCTAWTLLLLMASQVVARLAANCDGWGEGRQSSRSSAASGSWEPGRDLPCCRWMTRKTMSPAITTTKHRTDSS